MKFIFLTIATPAFALFGLGPWKNIPGKILDVPAFESVTHIVVISGTTKYPQAQETLLSELEGQWKSDGCWQITGHEEAKAKFDHGLVPAPSLSKWGTGSAVERMVLERIPERNSKTGVLIFWVLGWKGDKYRANTPLADAARIFIDEPRKKRQRYRSPSDYQSEELPYTRIAVAQLFDSKTGKELWRAYKSMARGTLEQTPESREIRKEQEQLEFQEFTEFFRPALTFPKDMKDPCSPSGKSAAYLAPTSKKKSPPADETITKLKNGDSQERVAAANALGKRGGDAAIDALVAALKDEDLKVRGTAAKALGATKDERAVQPLIALLDDGSKYIRALGAQALGAIGDDRARNPLKKLEKDKEELVRKEAEIALKKLPADPLDLEKMDLDVDVKTEGLNLKDDFFKTEEIKLTD